MVEHPHHWQVFTLLPTADMLWPRLRTGCPDLLLAGSVKGPTSKPGSGRAQEARSGNSVIQRQVKVIWCCYRAKASHYNRITPFCCEARQRGEERQVGGDNTNEGGQKALHPLRSIKRELGWSRRRGDYCGSIPFLFLASIGCVRQEEAEYGGEEQQRGRGAVAPRRRDEPAGGRVQGHGGGVRPQIPPPWAQGKPVQLLRRQAHQSPRPPRNLAFFLLWFRNRRSAGVSFASFILFRVLFSANAKK